MNYNWQFWNTFAFSIYAGQTNSIDKITAKNTCQSVLRFLNNTGIIKHKVRNGFNSEIITDSNQITIKAEKAGIYYKIKNSNEEVSRGDHLADILDPYDGTVLSRITSPVSGTIFFAHNKPLVLQNSPLFKIIV